MILDDHFDRVLVISLPDAHERASRALRELREKGLSETAEIFKAVSGKLCPPSDWWLAGAGAWGCMQSHYRAVQGALLDGVERLLILEDDCIWQKDSAPLIADFMAQVPGDWGQIYFGGQHRNSKRPEWLKDKPAVLRARSVHRTHAYAISRGTMGKFLKHIVYAPDYIEAAQDAKKPHKRHIDHQLEEAHQRGDWPVYCPSFWLAGQGENHSSINGKPWPSQWWHLSWRENHRRLPVVICDREPDAMERKWLHFGRHLDPADETVDLGVAGASDAADLIGIFEKIASEAMGLQRLPAMSGKWPEKTEWLRRKWSVPVLLLSENPDLPGLCDFPSSKLFRHDWINPKPAAPEPETPTAPQMHTSVAEFVKRIATSPRIHGKRVLELGSYNVNGSARDWIETHAPAVYHGIDMQAQARYVDQVADAIEETASMEPGSWDVVVCTEMLEHVEKWRELLEGLHRVLKPGGLAIVTTRGPGFPLHGFPEDFWRFTAEDFGKIFAGYQMLYLSDDPMPQHPGVLFAGVKRGDLDFLSVQPRPVALPYHTAEACRLRLRMRESKPTPPRPLAAFYHVACIGNWREVVTEQLSLFAEAGLSPETVVLGDEKQAAEIAAMGAVVVERHDDHLLYETPTLDRLWMWCRQNPDGAVLYAHTKGVSHHATASADHRAAWRRLMGQQVITRWETNLGRLSIADMIGVDSQTEKGMHCYPGNFWMARADWVSKLPDPWTFRRDGGPDLFGQPWERMHAEVWIGSRNGHHAEALMCRGQQLWSDTVFELLEISSLAGRGTIHFEDGSSEHRAAKADTIIVAAEVIESRCNGAVEQILMNLTGGGWRHLIVATTPGAPNKNRASIRRARSRAPYDVEAATGVALGSPARRFPRGGGGEWLIWSAPEDVQP